MKKENSSAAHRTWWFLVFAVWCSLFASGCGDSTSGDQKLERLETEIIRVKINGQAFDIPLRYMYGEAIEKLGSKHWPKAKEGRVEVGYISLSMLLPDLKPYYPKDDARWKVLGFGEKVEVSLMKEEGGNNWFAAVLQRTEKYTAAGKFYRKESDRYGLMNYTEANENTYFAKDGRGLLIHCSNKGTSPGCRLKSDYRDGLVLKYSYSQNYLPQWQQIDDGLKSLFDSFSIPVQKNPTK